MAAQSQWDMSRQDMVDAAIMLLIALVWGAIVCYATFIRPGPDSIAVAQLVTPVIIAVISWRAATVYLRRKPNGNGNGNGKGGSNGS